MSTVARAAAYALVFGCAWRAGAHLDVWVLEFFAGVGAHRFCEVFLK